MALYVYIQNWGFQNNRVYFRIFRDRRNPQEYMDDGELVWKYRLDLASIFDLCQEIRWPLERQTLLSQSLPVSLQLVIALRFYATWSFQSVIADSHGIAIPSVSRSINAISAALTKCMGNYILFPRTRENQLAIKQKFYEVDGLPNIIGAVDGTFIPIKAPSVDKHLYVTLKGFHALNIQGICDANNLFLNLVVRFPGSTHDAFIWNSSSVSRYLEEQQFPSTWLLGNSAYPLKPYLLTPFQNPVTPGERRYNTAYKRSRSTIERTYGIWKSHFRCLHKSSGHLMYTPFKCVRIICVLVSFTTYASADVFP